MNRTAIDQSLELARSHLALPKRLHTVDLREVWWRVFEFRYFKTTHGNVPFRRYGLDKPSWRNGEGRLVAAYRDDAFHHCHLGVVGADPILAYRVVAPDHLVMVCVTTHKAMFKGDRRAFVRAYAAHFPNTLRRRPSCVSARLSRVTTQPETMRNVPVRPTQRHTGHAGGPQPAEMRINPAVAANRAPNVKTPVRTLSPVAATSRDKWPRPTERAPATARTS